MGWCRMALKKKRGGQPGNKNAIGNKGGGAPLFNKNALKHGIYIIYPPRSMKEKDYLIKAEQRQEIKRAITYTNMLIMVYNGEITKEQFDLFWHPYG